MTSLTVTALFFVALIVCGNVVSTRLVLMDKLSERRQKLLQLVFIWLLPGIGAAVVYAVMHEPKMKNAAPPPRETSLGEDPNVGLRNSASDYFQDGHRGE